MRSAAVWVLTALASGLAWWAWLGWDDEYQVDPVTLVESGPYEPWQVVGSAATVVVLVVVATLVAGRAQRANVVFATAAGYAVAWAQTNLTQDDSGLAGVGAVMVLVGVGLGAAVVATLTLAVRERFASEPVPGTPPD